MSNEYDQPLSRRERQIMEIIYTQGRASAAEVMQALPDPPSYSTVRALLRFMEEKGYVKHTEEGRKYIYSPTLTAKKASRSALKNLLSTFFNDSVEQAFASLLDLKAKDLSGDDLDRLAQILKEKKKKGK